MLGETQCGDRGFGYIQLRTENLPKFHQARSEIQAVKLTYKLLTLLIINLTLKRLLPSRYDLTVSRVGSLICKLINNQ